MITYILIILVYAFLLFSNKEVTKTDHYAASLTIAVWMILAYLLHDMWLVYIICLIVTGVCLYSLAYYWAYRNKEVASFSDYVIKSYKADVTIIETNLFVIYFLIYSPLIDRVEKSSIYIYLVPIGYFIVERIIYSAGRFWLAKKNGNTNNGNLSEF